MKSYVQPTIVIPPDDHKLQYNYWLWFSRRSPGKTASVQNYDQNLKLIGHFGSVEQFWSLYSHLARPCDLQSHSDFHLFKDGIKPMWELANALVVLSSTAEDGEIKDEANSLGGKWIVRLRKGLASRCWENLVLAMLGEQFMVGEEICGAVVSIRFQFANRYSDSPPTN
uniref:Eukaryotic translation initiation factor 4E n=1 Tax=Timema cristinae TaxID=61476 RepID=A0A7R9GS06_TIMCR|nr:unnamed protein product [Timema cristinae]